MTESILEMLTHLKKTFELIKRIVALEKIFSSVETNIQISQSFAIKEINNNQVKYLDISRILMMQLEIPFLKLTPMLTL